VRQAGGLPSWQVAGWRGATEPRPLHAVAPCARGHRLPGWLAGWLACLHTECAAYVIGPFSPYVYLPVGWKLLLLRHQRRRLFSRIRQQAEQAALAEQQKQSLQQHQRQQAQIRTQPPKQQQKEQQQQRSPQQQVLKQHQAKRASERASSGQHEPPASRGSVASSAIRSGGKQGRALPTGPSVQTAAPKGSHAHKAARGVAAHVQGTGPAPVKPGQSAKQLRAAVRRQPSEQQQHHQGQQPQQHPSLPLADQQPQQLPQPQQQQQPAGVQANSRAGRRSSASSSRPRPVGLAATVVAGAAPAQAPAAAEAEAATAGRTEAAPHGPVITNVQCKPPAERSLSPPLTPQLQRSSHPAAYRPGAASQSLMPTDPHAGKSSTSASASTSDDDEEDGLGMASACIVCWEQRRSVVLVPCGHLALCRWVGGLAQLRTRCVVPGGLGAMCNQGGKRALQAAAR